MSTYFNLWISQNRPLLAAVNAFSCKRGVKLYVVGGILRDILCQRQKQNPDIDFCLAKGAISFGRALAKQLHAGFVVLDEVNKCCRLVKQYNGVTYTLDFSDFRAPELEQDLLHRDFTINSMAVELEKLLKAKGITEILIDPYHGRKDLKDGVIRMVCPSVFKEDPLRIIRAFGMAAVFNARIQPQTVEAAKKQKKLLKSVSMERIRDELFRILGSGRGYTAIADLDKYRILEYIIPQISKLKGCTKPLKYKVNVWKHTLDTLKHTELILGRLQRNQDLADFIAQEVCSGRTYYALLKLAALLHDIGKPATFSVCNGKINFYGHERLGSRMVADIAADLRLSTDEIRILRKLTFLHLRPGYLVNNPRITSRAKFRFERDAGKDTVAVLLLALADQRATRGYVILERCRSRYERVVPQLIRAYFAKLKQVPQERLVTGHDVMQHLKIAPSVIVGKILRQLEELQATNKIKTKEQALNSIEQIYKREVQK